MKNKLMMVGATILMSLAVSNTASAKKTQKEDICHYDADAGVFDVINVSGNAVAKHFANHGDVYPGEFYADSDGDGFGAGAVIDDCPNDGAVGNADDAFPDDPTESSDADGDGVGDNSDACPEEAGTGPDGCPVGGALGTDLVTGKFGEHGHTGQIRLKFGDDMGNFSDLDVPLNVQSRTHRVSVGDLDGDGDDDIVVTRSCDGPAGGKPPCSGLVFSALGPFSPSSPVILTQAGTYLSSNLWNVRDRGGLHVMGDFNNDGILDLVISGWELSSTLLGNGDGTFAPGIVYGGAGDSRSMDSGDIDGDGNLDFAINSSAGSSNMVIHYGDGTGAFASGVGDSFGGLFTNENLHLADVDADEDLDILTGGWGYGIRVFVNNGGRNFTAGGTIGSHGQIMLAEDLNGDGAADVVETPGDGDLRVHLNDGSGGFNPPTLYQGAPGSRSAITVDLNEDGKTDVAIVNALVFGPVNDSNNITVMPGNGDGTFGTPFNIPGYRNNASIASGNLD